jgi:UPF0271 protein
MNDRKIYVLDSTAFYTGMPFQGEEIYYTTYHILDEIRHQNIASSLIHSRVQVIEPSKESIQKVRNSAVKTGDIKSLSEADVAIIASALDLASRTDECIILVTDDFAVRNVAEAIGINLSETTIKGGWKQISWIVYCQGCGKEYSNSKLEVCEICGTTLRRKPRMIP